LGRGFLRMKAHQRKIREQFELLNNVKEYYPIQSAALREISYDEAKKIILEYEWLGTMGTTQIHFGIFYSDFMDGEKCAGVVCFGYFQAMNTSSGGHPYAPYVGVEYAKKGIQLTRGACVHWAHEHSGSKLIGYGLREIAKRGYKYVVAFSDPKAGEIGTLYQATNWYYLGATKDKHWDIYDKSGKLFLNDRDIFKKYKFRGKRKILELIKNTPHYEIRLRESKSRYIKLIGSKRENREMYKVLGPKILPYPKRKEG
jgi:hypothetical protein